MNMRKLSLAVAFVWLVAAALVAGPARAQDAPAPTPVPAPDEKEPAKEAPAKKPAKKVGKTILVERVVGVVNDTVLLESEVLQRAAANAADLDEITDKREKDRQWKALVRQTLGDMVDEELILQAAAEANLEVTEDEIEKAVDEVKRSNKLTDKQLVAALAAQGYTIEAYRKDVKRNILRLRAINILVRPRVTVSDDEVKAFYDRMLGKNITVTEVHVSQILLQLSDAATADEKDAARRHAGELIERARGGEDFAQLALANSQDQDTKQKGGDMGWFKRGELPTEWEEVLFSMDSGEIRGPIQGPRGLHVFQVTDQKKESVRPYEQVKERLRQQLYNEQLEKQTKVWIEELKKKAHVEVKM